MKFLADECVDRQIVKAEVVADAIKDHAGELLQAFSVITPVTVRIRGKISQR